MTLIRLEIIGGDLTEVFFWGVWRSQRVSAEIFLPSPKFDIWGGGGGGL